jgi:hypothetical protein
LSVPTPPGEPPVVGGGVPFVPVVVPPVCALFPGATDPWPFGPLSVPTPPGEPPVALRCVAVPCPEPIVPDEPLVFVAERDEFVAEPDMFMVADPDMCDPAMCDEPVIDDEPLACFEPALRIDRIASTRHMYSPAPFPKFLLAWT